MKEQEYILTATQLKQLKAFFLEQKAKYAIHYLNMLGSLPTVEKDDGKSEE